MKNRPMRMRNDVKDELAAVFARDIEYSFQVARGYGYRSPSRYAVGVSIHVVADHELQVHLRIDDEIATVYLSIPRWESPHLQQNMAAARAFREGIAGAASQLVLDYLHGRPGLAPDQRVAMEALKQSDDQINRDALERMKTTVFR